MMSLGFNFGLASLGVWVAIAGCGKSSDNEANVPGSSAGAGSAGTAGAPSVAIVLPELGGSENTVGASAGAGGLPTQPAVDCGQAGGDSAGAGGTNSADSADECASPPSVCADDGRLVYYSSGVCVAGACRWTAYTLDCPIGCSRGSCASPTTEK